MKCARVVSPVTAPGRGKGALELSAQIDCDGSAASFSKLPPKALLSIISDRTETPYVPYHILKKQAPCLVQPEVYDFSVSTSVATHQTLTPGESRRHQLHLQESSFHFGCGFIHVHPDGVTQITRPFSKCLCAWLPTGR